MHFLVYIKCISIYTGKIRNAKTFLLFDIVRILRYTLEVPVAAKYSGEDVTRSHHSMIGT
jgi:hypothetical protein